MTALSTRDALAKELARHDSARAVLVGAEVRWVCQGCGQPLGPSDPAEAFADLNEHRTDALMASGVVVDVGTLADDEALVEHLQNWVPLGFVPDKDPYANATEAARGFLRALAAALTERVS